MVLVRTLAAGLQRYFQSCTEAHTKTLTQIYAIIHIATSRLYMKQKEHK